MLTGCINININYNHGIAMILDDIVNNGISKFSWQKDHWGKCDWKIAMFNVLLDGKDIERPVSSYLNAEVVYKLDVAEIQKLIDNIEIIKIDRKLIENIGTQTVFNEYVIENDIDAIFIFYLLPNSSGSVSIRVGFYWPKNERIVDYLLDFHSDKPNIKSRELVN